LGDYTKGVALLVKLYVSTLEPSYLFNQGRCFEQNGKYEEAILHFREYQRTVADQGRAPDDRSEKHIADCQALLDKQKAAAAIGTPPPAVPPAQPSAPHPEVVVQPEITPVAPPAEAPNTGRGLRVAGLAVAAAGLGGLATGVILNLKANNLAKDLEAANGDGAEPKFYSRSKESTRSSYQTWGWVAYGSGAACLAGGAIMYFLGYQQGRSQVAFVPSLADGRVGAVVQGAF
jgi:hypothetical protein